eukprot:TRINITY_DN9644_c0_g1_i1.p1 TRINITY_DN9644_c0_g1~~TRINITY_DN9644_c0_g1_i1.p1  ORF type:complete len:431 (+),score=81.70 TRINITY_DN9644_c0_g1_i1:65-1357(+)
MMRELLLGLAWMALAWGALGEDCWFVSNAGSDETGNGTSADPWRTIQNAIRHPGNTRICILAGTFKENITVGDERGVVVLQGVGNPVVDLRVTLTNETSFLFQSFSSHELVFMTNLSERIEMEDMTFAFEPQAAKDDNTTQAPLHLEARAVAIRRTTFALAHQLANESAVLLDLWPSDSLALDEVTLANTKNLGFRVRYALDVRVNASTFVNNSVGDWYLFSFEDSNSSTISFLNCNFLNNTWALNTSYLIDLPPSSNIHLLSSTFSCNSQASLYPPIFSATNGSISAHDLRIPPECPISCPVLASTITSSIFACQPCPPGSRSLSNFTNCSACPRSFEVLNNECVICAAGSFSSTNLGCTPCPVFSSQGSPGQDHCTCFTHRTVSEGNLDDCKNAFWGIIVGVLYFTIFVGIGLYWRMKKETIVYDQVN